MCGIAGCSIPTNAKRNASKVARSLLLGIEERGKDATGAAWYSPSETGSVYFQKDAVPASSFVHSLQLPASARTMVLHTRLATQGSPAVPANNHPFVTGNVVGVHNGCLFNDDTLTKTYALTRQAETDSEAAFALLNEMVGGDTYTKRAKARVQMLEEIQGSAALAWLDMRDPGQLHIARINSSPVVHCTTDDGAFYFASTTTALIGMLRRFYGTGSKLPEFHYLVEGDYIVVEEGKVIDTLRFEPAWAATYASRGRFSEWEELNQRALSGYKGYDNVRSISGANLPVTKPAPWALAPVRNGNSTTHITCRMSTKAVLDAHRHANALTEKLLESGPLMVERQTADGRARDAYLLLLDLLSEGSGAVTEDENRAAEEILELLHADLEEGDRVITKFGTADHVGYVARMGEFPNGDYEIMVQVKTPDMENATSTAIMYRKWWEFTELPEQTTTTNPA